MSEISLAFILQKAGYKYKLLVCKGTTTTQIHVCAVKFLSNRTEAAVLNTSFSCYWDLFVVCVCVPDEWRVPVHPASCPATSQGSDVGLPPRSSCLYFCWHPSTTQPSCFQPSTSFAAACHYTLIKTLDMKGGWLAFFHFPCLPSVENSVYAQADVICSSHTAEHVELVMWGMKEGNYVRNVL